MEQFETQNDFQDESRNNPQDNSNPRIENFCQNDFCEDFVTRIAREKFGIKYLYPWQRLVIANILEADECSRRKDDFDCDDESDWFCKGKQIVLLPTGAGKSLCFQIPAFVLDGISLIIYPLLALMSDQQRRMEEVDLRSVIFRGGQTESEREENFLKLKSGVKIILANPEVLQNETLLLKLRETGVKHIVVDEAHCVSEWGDSFRPAYLGLENVIKKINPPIITAFTATASPAVLERTAQILFNGQAHIVRGESDRDNIRYFVRYSSAKKKEALVLAKQEEKPMIIFCGTRAKAEDAAQELNTCFGNSTAKYYHAGLEKSEKEEVEKWFYDSKDGVLCATCAYGMGVDKKDVRTVVHIDAPSTAEAYIQEAGRGGRDGSVAKAILIWSLEDSLKFSAFKSGTREAAMREFAETKNCRRQVLLDALGAEKTVCNGCDLCDARNNRKQKDLKNGKRKIFYAENCSADWQTAYSLIKKSRNFYSEEDAESEFFDNMNKINRKKLGVNIWTHGDAEEVVKQLKDSDKIEADNFFWKGKLKICKKVKKKPS